MCDYVLLFSLADTFCCFCGWNLLEVIGFQLDFSCQNYIGGPTKMSQQAETPQVQGFYLALNSMRLTRSHVKKLAKSFELPLGASTAETRQMVEEKITELGKQPQNVHILIRQDEES